MFCQYINCIAQYTLYLALKIQNQNNLYPSSIYIVVSLHSTKAVFEGKHFFVPHTPDFGLSSPLCILPRPQASFLASGWLVRWLNVAEQVGQLFRILLEGSSKEEEGHHHRPVPPSLDNASAAAAADDDVGGDRRQGFCCLFVGQPST